MERRPTLEAELRRAPFTLAMSSGFFGFFAHAGFVAALDELGLQPASYAGSSAGALVGACRASGLGVDEIRETFFSLTKEDFWDPRRVPRGGLLRGKLFRDKLRSMLKPTFRDADPIVISVFDVLSRQTRVRREGDLPLAVHASCAVPLMFEPDTIIKRALPLSPKRTSLATPPRESAACFLGPSVDAACASINGCKSCSKINPNPSFEISG